MKMNPVVHFEMPADDRARMAEFYTKAFGWQTKLLGPEMNDYVLATTTESDETGHPTQPGAINGGFEERPRTEGNRVAMLQPLPRTGSTRS